MLDPLSPNMFQYCFAAPSPRTGPTSDRAAQAAPLAQPATSVTPGRAFADRMRAAIQQTSTAHVLLVRDWDSPRDSATAAGLVSGAKDIVTSALSLPVPPTAISRAREGAAHLDVAIGALTTAHRTAPSGASRPMADGMMSLLRAAVAADAPRVIPPPR